MDKFSNVLLKIIEYIGALMLVLLTLSLFMGVLARYIFGISIPELEVLRNFSIFWLVFLGSAVAVKEKAHLDIDIFSEYMSEKVARVKDQIVYLLILIAIIILVIVGIESWSVGMTRRELTTIRFLDSAPNLLYYYSSILIGSILMLYFHLRFFKERFLKRGRGDK